MNTVVSFTAETALTVASALLGEELKVINEDCKNAIGEIAYMIAGYAKKEFPKTNTTISVPGVVLGSHKIVFPSGLPIIAMPCRAYNHQFAIEVAL